MNEGLVAFLEKLLNICPEREKENVNEVLSSLSRCPIQVNFDDAKDLIGVDNYIENKLNSFFAGKPKYIPKEGSIPRRILKILYDAHCTAETGNGFTKSDLMREMGLKQAPFSKLSKGKSNMYDPLSSMKTLESHELIVRLKTNGKHEFALTEEGNLLCADIFSQKTSAEAETSPIVPRSCKMHVLKNEIELRSSIDVIEALRRSGREFVEDKTLPVGSIWFVRGNDVYDTVVQFDQYRYLSNGKYIRRISASPFRNKFVVITSKEGESTSMTKLRSIADFGIKVMFLDTPAGIAQFLDTLCDMLDRSGLTIGSKKEIIELCEQSQFCKKVGAVWQQVLTMFPYCGPQVAASICNVFPSPDQLYEFLADKEEQVEAMRNAVAAKGKKPRVETCREIVRLFGRQ